MVRADEFAIIKELNQMCDISSKRQREREMGGKDSERDRELHSADAKRRIGSERLGRYHLAGLIYNSLPDQSASVNILVL